MAAVAFHDPYLGHIVPGRNRVPAGLQPNAARGAAAARSVGFDGTIGGVGSRATKSDHPHGNAIDLMTGNNTTYGWELANWYWQNRDALGLTYIIFDGKIASASRGWQWRPYSHPAGRTDGTALHRDHVHVSFRGGDPVQSRPLTPFRDRTPGAVPQVPSPAVVTPPTPTAEPLDPRLVAAQQSLRDLPAVHAAEIAAGRLTPEEARYREAVQAYYTAGLQAQLAQERAARLKQVHQAEVAAGRLDSSEAARRETGFGQYVNALVDRSRQQAAIYHPLQEQHERSQIASKPPPPKVDPPVQDDRQKVLEAITRMAGQRPRAVPGPVRVHRPNAAILDPAQLTAQLADQAARPIQPTVVRRAAPRREDVLSAMGRMVEAPQRPSREESLFRLRR